MSLGDGHPVILPEIARWGNGHTVSGTAVALQVAERRCKIIRSVVRFLGSGYRAAITGLIEV